MGKSYRKSPFVGLTTAKSEKDDKRRANKALRRKVNKIKDQIADCDDIDDVIFPTLKECSDVYTFAKDGKQRLDKDNDYYNKYMRK